MAFQFRREEVEKHRKERKAGEPREPRDGESSVHDDQAEPWGKEVELDYHGTKIKVRIPHPDELGPIDPAQVILPGVPWTEGIAETSEVFKRQSRVEIEQRMRVGGVSWEEAVLASPGAATWFDPDRPPADLPQDLAERERSRLETYLIWRKRTEILFRKWDIDDPGWKVLWLRAQIRMGKLAALDSTRELLTQYGRDEFVRFEAMTAFGEAGNAKMVDLLLEGLKDSHARVRNAATRAFVRIRDKRAAAALTGLLLDPVSQTRVLAATALAQIDPKAATQALTVVLRVERHPKVRVAFRELLQNIQSGGKNWSERMRERSSEQFQALYVEGIRLARNGNYLYAESAFQAALQSDPSHADSWYQLAVCFVALNRMDEARSVLQMALKLDPTSSKLQQELERLPR